MIDAGDALDNASAIEKVTEQLLDGEVCLIALEQEAEEGQMQKMLAKFDVAVVENDAAEVAEEIQQALEAQEELEREARAKLRESRKEEFKKNIEEKRAQLESGFESVKEKLKKN